MEARKLQPTGGTSVSVTLPKRWVKRSKLRPKDRVLLHESRNGVLSIEPEQRRAPLSRSLAVDALSGAEIARELIAHYIAGIDEIELTAAHMNSARRARIREAARLCIGLEIIEDGGESVVLRHVLDLSKFPIPQSSEKLFRTVFSMVDDALASVRRGDARLARDVIERDAEVDKLQLSLKRQYYSMLRAKTFDTDAQMSISQLHYLEGVAQQLERIADHALKIARAGAGRPTTPTKAFKLASIIIIDATQRAQHMCRHVDKRMAHEALAALRRVETALVGVSAKTTREVTLVDSLDRIRGYLANIAEMTIDQAVMEADAPETAMDAEATP